MIRGTLNPEYRKALAAGPVLLPALLLSYTDFEVWCGAALLAGLAAFAWYDWRDGRVERRALKWLKTGCCLACGYDLRASPAYCPECGTAVEPPGPVAPA